MTASLNRPRPAASASGCGVPLAGWTADASADQRRERSRYRQAGPNRGRQRGHDRARVLGPQIPIGRWQENLRTRVDLRLQRPPQHRAERVLTAGDVGVVPKPNQQRGVEVARRDGIGAHRRECGADGGVERRDHHLRRQPPRGGVRGGRQRSVGVAAGRVLGRDHHGVAVGAEQVDAAAGQRAVGDQGGAADCDDTEDLVDDIAGGARGGGAEAGFPDPLHRVQVGLGVGQRRDAQVVGQPTQPVQPGGRRGLPGPRVRRGARLLGGAGGGVGDDVTGGHRVDGDQQVRVDRQAHRAADGAVRVDITTGGELGGGQQHVQPAAAGQRGGQIVVHQAHRNGAAGNTGRQPGPVGQRPQHGDRHRFRGVGRDHGVQRARRAAGGVQRIGRHAEDGQQETGVVQPRRFAVVGRAVDVHQQRVDAGRGDVQRMFGRRPQRGRQGELHLLAALEHGGHRRELHRGLVLVGVAVEIGAQSHRDGDRAACSRRSITSWTGRSPILVTVPATVTTGSLVVVTTCGVTWSMLTWTNGVAPGSPAAAVGTTPTLRPTRMPTTASRCDSTPRRSRSAVEPRSIPISGCCPHLELLCIVVGGYGPGPRPFFWPRTGSSARRMRVREWVCGRRRGVLGGSGGRAAGPSLCNLSISSSATSASLRSSA